MNKTKSGFSLIELLVVITIIGLLVGWVIPNFSGFLLRMKLDNSLRILTTTLRNAASHSTADRRDVRLVIHRYDSSTPDIIDAKRNAEVRKDGTDNWQSFPGGFAQMIPPVNIEYPGADATTLTFDMTMYGTTAPTPAGIYITYLLPGATTPSPGHLNGVAPVTENTSAIWHNCITQTGLQQFRTYKFLRA